MEKDIKGLIPNIGYNFKNEKLLKNALTHSSYANENNKKSYERLEFLGDSILSYIVSVYFYENFKDMPEGKLSKLRSCVVCERALEQAAKKLDFGSYLIISHGEEITGGRERTSILADVFEAVLAAIYLDGGIEPAKDFVMNNLSEIIEHARFGKGIFHDYKSELQELVQHKEENVTYKSIDEKGPEHCKTFTASVIFKGKEIAKGKGKTKKAAEQNAAKKAIKEFKANV